MINGKPKEYKHKTIDNLIDCTSKNFQRTETERQYYKLVVELRGQNMLCYSDKTLQLEIEGNLQSRKVKSETNSYMSL